MIDLFEELQKMCGEVLGDLDRKDCMCRVEQLLADYFKPNPAKPNPQQTEPDPV